MKPRFSLTLDHDGIGLYHRAKSGWTPVGEVALDDPGLTEALRMLRSTASALEGSGVLSKLVLPESQILYTTVAVGNGDPEQAVRAGLDGLTPYGIEELAFDYEIRGTSAHVAAVALETLHEAEAFAVEHRFNPVYFTALPDPETFPREPWFGECMAAVKLLPEGETLEADSDWLALSEMPEPPAAPSDTPAEPPLAPAETATPPAVEDSAPPIDAAPPDPGEAATETTKPSPPEAPPIAAPLDAPDDRPAFTSRRSGPGSATPSDLGEQAPRFHFAATPDGPAPSDIADRKAGITAPVAPDIPKAAKSKKPKPKPAAKPASPSADGKMARTKGALAGAAKAIADRAPKKTAAKSGPPTAPKAPIAVARTSSPPVTKSADEPPSPQAASLSLGVFAQDKPNRGRPLLGLALTAILIVALGAVALFTLSGDDDTSQITPPAVTPSTAPQEVARVAPQPRPESVAPVQPQLPDETAVQPAEPEPVAEPEPAPVVAEVPAPFTEEQAQATYASSGIWARAPEAPGALRQDRLDTLYFPSIDPKVNAQDAIALPVAMPSPVRPEAPANPPAQGQTFDLDENGRVVPTPEGALSPDGVMVFSGKPPLTPQPRPEREQGAVQIEDPALTQIATVKPRGRPTDLVERSERAKLGGRTLNELAALKPRSRPVSAQEQAIADALAAAQADDSAAVSDSPLAVATSRKPNLRPSDFSAKVARAEKATAATAVPAAAAVTPRIPTTASVAKQATLPNAINLRKVNLIGVYGSSGDRRALVRLPSGRYVKLQVGDRLDGGRVAAIGESELRYTKGSRSILLKLPNG